MESMATREDVANAKYQVTVAWGGAIVATLGSIGSVISRFWPT